MKQMKRQKEKRNDGGAGQEKKLMATPVSRDRSTRGKRNRELGWLQDQNLSSVYRARNNG
jgi:hypothetical protein